jgi:hypothetical protein
MNVTITNVRDPWADDLPEILRKDRNIFAVDETAFLQRETGIDGLRVFFNIDRLKFVVQDTKAPGGPVASYVMIVQTPDGMPADVDHRTVQTIRRLYQQSRQESLDEIAKAELAREQRVKSERSERAYKVAEALRWVGRNVVQSVASRDRSAAREAIRKEAS